MKTTDVTKLKKKMFPVSPVLFYVVESEKGQKDFRDYVIVKTHKLFTTLSKLGDYGDTKKYTLQFIGSIRIKELKEKE